MANWNYTGLLYIGFSNQTAFLYNLTVQLFKMHFAQNIRVVVICFDFP